MNDDQEQAERQRDLETKGTPLDAEESAASKFRQNVASKKADLEDFEEEENLWSGGYSPKAMIGTWGLMLIASIVLLVVPFVTELPLSIALILLVLIWLIGGLRYAWRRLGVHYQLTTQRFIHQTGVLTRKTDRIEVIDIDDVSFTQGPVQRMFGVGTIVLTGSDRTHPTLAMLGIAEVKDVAGLIDDIRRKERRRRSLHIEAI
ncbi:MAG: PH domain-containing protein [Rubripirellula sp.]